jgi:tetratricopeptide (TPR) repeat protein
LALQSFEKAVQTDPNHVSARHQYAYELEMAKRYAEALEQYKTVIQQRPNLTDAYYGAGLSSDGLNRPSEAQEYYQIGCEMGSSHCCKKLKK